MTCIRALILVFLIYPVLSQEVVRAEPVNTASKIEGLVAEDRAAICEMIKRQLDAFRQDDAETAFSLAAPSIQYLFSTPKRFMIMVKRSYRPVNRSAIVEFRAIREVEAKGLIHLVISRGSTEIL